MAKLSRVGSGFVRHEGDLINLRDYRDIRIEDDADSSYIIFTPFVPSKDDTDNGVDGSWAIAYVEQEQRDKDFKMIEDVLKQE